MNTGGNPSPDLQHQHHGSTQPTSATASAVDECKVCGLTKVANMQEHIFSVAHIAQVKALLDTEDDQQQQQQQTSTNPANTNSGPDAMNLYSQFFLQNHLFSSGQQQQQQTQSGPSLGGSSSAENADLMNLQHHLAAAAVAAANTDRSNHLHHQQMAAAVAAMQMQQQQSGCSDSAIAPISPSKFENNLILQINETNKHQQQLQNQAQQQQHQTPSNSEILQQLYNYSQMSGELIK